MEDPEDGRPLHGLIDLAMEVKGKILIKAAAPNANTFAIIVRY